MPLEFYAAIGGANYPGLAVDDSGITTPGTTTPMHKLHVVEGCNVGIGDLKTPPQAVHIVTSETNHRIIICDYCGHRYHTDTQRLYCAQCGAPLPERHVQKSPTSE